MNKATYQLPNIFVVYKTAFDANPSFKVEPVLSDFLLIVAKRKPSWEFRAETTHLYHNTTVNTFRVYAQGQLLGSVEMKPRGYSMGVQLECDAIGVDVKRGNKKWSGKASVAADMFKKYFKEFTPNQTLARVNSIGTDQYHKVAADDYFRLSYAADKVKDKIKNITQPLTEQQKEALIVLGLTPVEVDNIQTALVDKLFSEEQKAMVGRGLPAYEYAGIYYVGTAGGYSSYDNHNLPTSYKEKIGLLKLVEEKTMVPNVGYRVGANQFFILEDAHVQQEAA